MIGGSGPPLLLLHGYPQTHAMWHKIAPRSRSGSRSYAPTCAATAIRRNPTAASATPYSKRAMAADMVEVMRALGFERFAWRPRSRRARGASARARSSGGGRARRGARHLADADHVRQDRQGFANAYYHWFFLIQPFDLPERLIGADPVITCARKPAAGDRRRTSSIRARSPSTSAAMHSPRRSMRRARTTGRRHRSTSSTTTPTSPPVARSPVRCSCCGVTTASSSVASIRSPTGARWQATCAGARCRRAITSPKRCRTRRWPSCGRSSSPEAVASIRGHIPLRRTGSSCYNCGLGPWADDAFAAPLAK